MATTTAAERPRVDLLAGAARLLEADLSRPVAFAILGFVFLALRAPFLAYGHGTDPDAWRVAISAHYLLDHGQYFPSRLPGNPLHEMIMTLLIPGGWIATNLATALASLVGVWVFARIVSFSKLPMQGLLTVGFAFTPLLFINSIATMDYMWTLTCLLASYYLVLRGQPIWAGILMGCAIGLRLQSLAMGPALLFLLWRLDRKREIIPFGLASAGAAALCFAPVLATYGLKFFNFYDAEVDYQDVIRLLGKEALGVFGSLAVLAGAAVSLPRLKQLPRDIREDPQVSTWLVVIAMYTISFIRLPHEIAYLLPVFPFGFLIMARYYRPIALVGAIAAILLAGVIDITTPGDSIDMNSIRDASLGRGLILSNAQTMTAQHDFVSEVLATPVPDHSVVMVGFSFPQLAVRGRDHLDLKILERDYSAISMLTDRGEAVDEQHDIRYVWLLTYDTFEALRSQGYSFYMVPDAVGGTAALYDYRPTLFGANFLRLDQSSPSTSKGTASTDR